MKIDFASEAAALPPPGVRATAGAVRCPAPRPIARQSRRPWRQLREAVLALASGQAKLVHHAERRWASVTFSGARHCLALVFQGRGAIEAGERFIAQLPHHEFAVPHRLVAEATITTVEHTTLPQPQLVVTAELLVLEDA